jgi:hypothetical protein
VRRFELYHINANNNSQWELLYVKIGKHKKLATGLKALRPWKGVYRITSFGLDDNDRGCIVLDGAEIGENSECPGLGFR